MTEAGGPTTQAGIRFQNQVAALYLGRMLDPRKVPGDFQPIEVRVESPNEIDDFVVRYSSGQRRFFQVKLSLISKGDVWSALWHSFWHQIQIDFGEEDRIELLLGSSSHLAANLSQIIKRQDGSAIDEWLGRLTKPQRGIVDSIRELLGGDIEAVFQIISRLEITVWPAEDLLREYVPLWIPISSVDQHALHSALTDLASEGASTRRLFRGASLNEVLRTRFKISIRAPENWGGEKYRLALANLAAIEVPGTQFKQEKDASYIWPRASRYDRDRISDFDDEHLGWRRFSNQKNVDLSKFPSADLNAVVIVAGPGFGKTTLVHSIAHNSVLAGLLPAIVSLPKLSEANLSIIDYLTICINKDFDVSIDWRKAADIGLLVLLLDGLDEVSGERRTILLERLKFYRASHPGVPWLMTVRDVAALPPPGDAIILELVALLDEDVRRYVEFYRRGENGLASSLIDRMTKRPDLARLMRIPIFLSLMLVLRLESEDLRRSDLLDIYLETLFRPAAFKIGIFDGIETSILREIAEKVAFEALEADTIGIGIKSLERCIRSVAPSLVVDAVRESLVRRGVLRSSGLVRFNFPFPIVQEYLASTVLLEQYGDELINRLGAIYHRPWAQAVQFALERHRDPGPLIDEMLKISDDAFHTSIRLVGRCVANGMKVSNSQWEEIGNRFSEIWGRASFRANMLINGIIVDAFSNPLHPKIASRIGERMLIHEGAGTIAAIHSDESFSASVLGKLLSGDIDSMWNLSEFQNEVNKLGTIAFKMYIDRYREEPESVAVEETIVCLIGHMRIGCVDPECAFEIASDESVSLNIRLSCWPHSLRPLDEKTAELIALAATKDGYHAKASAARALSSPVVDISSVVRVLQSPALSQERAVEVVQDWFRYLDASTRLQTFRLLLKCEISEELQNLVLLYSTNAGDREALNLLLERLPWLDVKMVCATVALFGHFLERAPVEKAISVILSRNWSAKERWSISGSLLMGLTNKLQMVGMNAGFLESIGLHPGRTAVLNLFTKWIALDDYTAWQYLQLILNAAEIGLPDAILGVRAALDRALGTPMDEEYSASALAGHALEFLFGSGQPPSLVELEHLARTASYNLASSSIRLIGKTGVRPGADALTRLYSFSTSSATRREILGALEPLAGRLGLRVTISNDHLEVSEA